jgi:hypothetical protein
VAIAKMDQLINAMIHKPTVYGKDTATNEAAGICHTPWYGTGVIGAGAAPTGALNGVNFTATTTGQISSPAALAGAISYLSKWTAVHTGGIGHLWLIDRLWGNVPVVTTTGSQAITEPTLPARDESASTNGGGVFYALECSATTGNAGTISNTTIGYTNSVGTAGRTGTLSQSWPITALTGTWIPFSMQAGDLGGRLATSITLGTSYVSGAVHVMAYRVVASMPVPNVNTGNDRDVFGLNMPYVWDSSVLQLVYFTTGTTVGALSGELWYSQG